MKKKQSRAVRRKRVKQSVTPNIATQANPIPIIVKSASLETEQVVKDPQIEHTIIEQGEFMPYDENLLERSRTQWQFGDWESLAKLERNPLQHHPDRAKLALLAAAGHIQLGETNAARQFTRLAQDWGCSKKLISQILISGVHNTLGRAAVVSDQQPRALQHFENAITIGTPGSEVRLITQARIDSQLSQLGKPHTYLLASQTLTPPYKLAKSTAVFSNTEDFLEQALQIAPEDSVLLIAYAETAMRQGLYDEAIRRWQHLAVVLGEEMLQPYYDRLNEAYLNLKGFPVGTVEEEFLKGDRDKHELLTDIHQKLLPDFYFEIGVQTGKSLMLAKCRALGVDPMPQLKFPLNNQTSVIKATSDDFFAKQAGALLKQPPDLVFIDGMHLFEYVLRDFIHVERYSIASTLVVIDDIYPGHPAQAERDRRTRVWTGDVWKLLAILEEYRPDLFLQTLDAHPTGLLMVTGMDPANQILSQRYDEIIARYTDIDILPKKIMTREKSWSCSDKRIDRVIEKVNFAKQILQKRESLINDLRGLPTGALTHFENKLVIYTAIAGGVDNLHEPEEVTPGATYICFTDDLKIKSNIWQIRPFPDTNFNDDNVRCAKMIKILPHNFLPEYEISVWVDGNFLIKKDISQFVEQLLQEHDLASFRHPESRSGLEDEANACIKLKKDNPDLILAQINAYRLAGIPMDLPVIAAGIIVRRHNKSNIKMAMNNWWEEIKKYSRKDQISFSYITYLHALKYKIIDENVRDNAYFRWHKHNC